jgi:hypothetical protein
MKHLATLLALFALSTTNTYAQLGSLNPPAGVKSVDIGNLIGTFLQFAIGSGVVVFFFLFMWGSIQWLMSEGEKGALATARARISSAAIGLIILSSVWAVYEIVKSITYNP